MARNQDAGSISLDELLEQQKRQAITATVQEVPGDARSVKVTPWMAGGGCLCHLAINVPRSAIASLRPTGDSHPCCGKVLRVVEIDFKAGQTIPIDEVVGQMMARAAEGQEHGEHQAGDDIGAMALIGTGGGGGLGLSGDCLARFTNCLTRCAKRYPRDRLMRQGCMDSCKAAHRLCDSFGFGGFGGVIF